jgi:hypothetical protein
MKIVTHINNLKAYIFDGVCRFVADGEYSLKQIKGKEFYVVEKESHQYLYYIHRGVPVFLDGWHLCSSEEEIAFLKQHIKMVKGFSIKDLALNDQVAMSIKSRLFLEYMEGK